MSKFKKGDKVRWKGEDGNFYKKGSVHEILGESDGLFFLTDDMGSQEHSWSPSELSEKFEFCYAPASPIREKTVKEIVPGDYGRVAVGLAASGDRVAVGFLDYAGGSCRGALMSASELRDLARLATDLAAYLESKEAE